MSIDIATARLNKALVLLENNIQSKTDGANNQQTIGALQSENVHLRETITRTLGMLDGLIERVESSNAETVLK